jgi:hypothetical protein
METEPNNFAWVVENHEVLARRAIHAAAWRWLPGMLVWRPGKIWEESMVFVRVAIEQERNTFWLHEGWLPVLDDPATLGCLMSLVRAVWRSQVAQVSPSLPDGKTWSCYINNEEDRLFRECTEAQALVSALDAAPMGGK